MKKNSFFLKIFAALTVLTTVLLLSASIIFGRFLLAFSDSHIGEMQMNNTRGIPKHIEQLSSGLKRDALHLSLLLGDPRTSGVKDDSAQVIPISFLKETYETLRKLSRINPGLYTTYVYLENSANDYAISSRAGVYPLKNFLDQEWYGYYRQMPPNTNEVWLPPRTVHSSVNLTSDDEGGVVLTYIYKISPYTTPGLSGAFLFNLKEEYVSQLINGSSADMHERAVILSGDGLVISDKIKENIGTDQSGEKYIRTILDSPDDSGYLLCELDNRQMLVSYCKTDFQGWIFMEYASVDSTKKAFVNNLRAIVIMTAVVLGGGLTMAYAVSKRLYHPVRELMDDLTRNGKLKNADQGDLVILRKAIGQLLSDEETLRHDLERQFSSANEIFLRNMIHEGVSETEPPGEISGCFQRTTVAVLFSDDSSVSALRLCDTDRRFYLRNLMMRLISQIVLEHGMLQTGFFLKNDALVFLHYPDRTEPDYKKLSAQLSKYSEYVSSNLQISVTAGVSNPFRGISGIHEAYGETVEAAKRKLFLGYGQVILASGVPSLGEYSYPLEEESALIANIQCLDCAGAERGVTAFFDVVRSMPEISVDHALLILYQITGAIYKCLLQLGIRDSFYILQAEHLLAASSATSYLSLDEYEASLKEQLNALILSVRETKQHSADIFGRMMEYITDNYRHDISIDELAGYLGISYSYTRRIFKEHVGKNMPDYINELRIAESKQILLDSDATIAQIAASLGYNNDQSFVRYFKKYTGMSPGSFRKLSSAVPLK